MLIHPAVLRGLRPPPQKRLAAQRSLDRLGALHRGGRSAALVAVASGCWLVPAGEGRVVGRAPGKGLCGLQPGTVQDASRR
jgi:hypothetical protein